MTSVARTLLELAASVSATELARAIDRAERLELFDLAAVEELLVCGRGRAGVTTLRAAVSAWEPKHTLSELEDRFRDLLRKANLPKPRFNTLAKGNQRTHEVDCLWPKQRLAVQLDGFAFHRTRRDFERDRFSEADLDLAGFRILRLSWNDIVARGPETIIRLRRALD